MQPLRVISRHSPLAIIQVEEVFGQLPDLRYELSVFKSFGDKHKSISLMRDNLRSDFFTKELDEMLLANEADIAIHSAKDLPYPLPVGLEIIALTRKLDDSDSLVVREGLPTRLSDLPKGAVIGTSSPKRKQELESLRNDLTVKSIRGTIEERIEQTDKGDYDAVIVATCALQRLDLENRISEILPFKTHPLQGVLAVVAKCGRNELKEVFGQIDNRKNIGKVYLVGFGPGNPDLLTIGAEKQLREADIIYYDDLLDKEFLTKYKAEKIYVGKRKNVHSKEQADINQLMLDSATDGKTVVRLKGGDPMVFAHGGEEVEFLESNLIEVEVIPGISTANALASLCKIPLTHRDISSSVAFVSGHAPGGLQIPTADTLVYYMAGTKIKEIAQAIIDKGWKPSTPVALVYHVSMPDQQEFFYTLDQLTKQDIQFPTPIITIIGNVVNLRFKTAKEIAYQKNILVTGLDTAPYQQLGKIIHTPLIEIQAIPNNKELETAIHNLKDYENLLFTSRNTVEHFFEALAKQNKDSRSLAHLKVFSIGKITTKELLEHGIQPDYQATQEDSDGVVQLFKENNIQGRVLIPRSNIALGIIPKGLEALGLDVTSVIAYRNTIPDNPKVADLSAIDTIVFTSPSCIDNFMIIYGEIPKEKQIIVKGNTTYNHLLKFNFPEANITIFNDIL
jgi:uroporphyrinogen III methyltransferase/synthase